MRAGSWGESLTPCLFRLSAVSLCLAHLREGEALLSVHLTAVVGLLFRVDMHRYFLKDVQTVTGLPLVEENEITPLAWCITLTIQLMPLGEIRRVCFVLT